MKQKYWITRQKTLYVLVLALLLGGNLVSCTSPPLAPQIDPLGPETNVGAGKDLSIRANAENASEYEWMFTGDGELPMTTGPAVIYTASDEPGGMAIVSVTARNKGGSSPVTSLTIHITCPREAEGEGTVSPSIAISSITFTVNDVEQIVTGSGSLAASPNDKVQVKEIIVCVGAFEGGGGNVYVEFDPVEPNPTNPEAGTIIESEVKGTVAKSVEPGYKTIPGPDYTWTIGENWQHFAIVTVHYPAGGNTDNPKCEDGACETDDRVIIGW